MIYQLLLKMPVFGGTYCFIFVIEAQQTHLPLSLVTPKYVLSFKHVFRWFGGVLYILEEVKFVLSFDYFIN